MAYFMLLSYFVEDFFSISRLLCLANGLAHGGRRHIISAQSEAKMAPRLTGRDGAPFQKRPGGARSHLGAPSGDMRHTSATRELAPRKGGGRPMTGAQQGLSGPRELRSVLTFLIPSFSAMRTCCIAPRRAKQVRFFPSLSPIFDFPSISRAPADSTLILTLPEHVPIGESGTRF